MTVITAELVRDLREKTGAGMMDCKKALTEVNGDFEAAVDFLRKKGLSAAAKKSDRVSAQGLTAIVVDGDSGVVVEVNSETDFVALNDKFQSLVNKVANAALNVDNIDALRSAILSTGKSVADEVVEHIATIGENLNVRRMQKISVDNGVIGSYIHNTIVPGMGKISVCVALECADKSDATVDILNDMAKKLAMHIAAAKPVALHTGEVDPKLVERERQIFIDQSRASGKPDNIIEKMVDGRIRKFYEEIVLMEQTFVMDNKTKISEVIENLSKQIGSPVTLKSFVRFELGDGIEVAQTDFAAEVASISGV